MLRPDLKEFERLARDHSRVPVVKTISSDRTTPVAAFMALAAKEKHAFLLESVEGGEKIGRYTFLGVRPYKVEVLAAGGKASRTFGADGNPFLAELKSQLGETAPAKLEGLPPFTGGAVGYFAYDFVRRLEKLPSKAKDDLKAPDYVLMFFDRVLAFDHARQELHIIATQSVGKSARAAYETATKDIKKIEKKLRGARKEPGKIKSAKRLQWKVTTSREKFLKDVAKVKEYITAGDVFQTVISQRWETRLDVPAWEVYRALRRLNPSPYMYYLRMGDWEVLGSSPEMLVKARRDEAGNATKLQYRPIAGTRPRSSNEAEDKRLEAELRADEKERAEHIMLVDLGRNDLGRVSEYGSVKVDELMFVERYSHVMHLVSALQSKLRAGLTAMDAFAACFPAGTLSGAPKVRAMQIIEELEPVRRGIYGGAIFYADLAGNLDSCIAIRTMVVKGKRAYTQAGAGIVAESVAEKEQEECVNKAAALMRAAELAGKA